MLYTNYDYDKSKIKMEAGIFIPSSPKNYHELSFCEFFKKTIVIISERGDPDTPMMYHELSVRYLLWVVQIPPFVTANWRYFIRPG